ncbi:MAG: hypothetical protein AAGF67_18170 [Verrucomicrobiota bacterium]
MNANEPDPLDEWIQSRREQQAPTPSNGFSERVVRLLESPTQVSSVLLTIAALLAVALIGFFRMEIFTHLLLNSPVH